MVVRRDTSPKRIAVGVGGWSFPPWRGLFYPKDLPHARELSYMSRALSSIEINSTFYRLQTPATFRKWREASPQGFVFSVKAPGFVVARRDLGSADQAVARFMESGVLDLGEKLGAINWQLPPRKSFAATEIDAFLALLPRRLNDMKLRHAIEARHASFVTPQFVQLARRHGVAVVLAGDSEYPQIADATATFAYLRIMGTSERRVQGYSSDALSQWAARATAIAAGEAPSGLHFVETPSRSRTARDVFLYVISGAKRRNPAAAQGLLERLRG